MEALATFESAAKRYGSIAAVDGLSFDVPEGTVCGLLGPNGAGKTTAIRLLLGLARPSSGSTTLLGLRPSDPGFHRAVRRVGTLIEGPAIYARATARQNMLIEAAALGLEEPRMQIADLLGLVDLSERADTRAGRFSLGMKQRLGLAIALLGRPRLVVLDEPTNGLDPAGIVEIRKLIMQLPERGTTVLVSSHLLAEVELMCDRAAIIDRGRLIADGTIADLVSGHGATSFTARVDPARGAEAVAVLERAGLAATEVGEGGLEVTGPIESGADVSRPLAEAGIYVLELRSHGAGLEDVFLSLTGDGAGAASAGAEAGG